ncbi:MAG: ABC transporter permease, partial [Rubrivivax sp.]
LTEGLDLSMGSVLSLCGVALALQLASGQSLLVACGTAAFVGVAFGVFNGVCVSYLGMSPFVVTLGSFGVAQGLALALTEGNAVSDLGPEIEAFYDATVLGIPMLVFVAALVYAVFHVLAYHTRIGRYAVAIGGNRNALVTSGVSARLFHLAIYALAGLTVGLAALCLIARTKAGHPTIAIGMEFDAIAAVVLGGTQLERGKGWMFGAVLGVLAIGILRNGLNLIGVDTSLQLVAIGVLVLIVVGIGATQKGAA